MRAYTRVKMGEMYPLGLQCASGVGTSWPWWAGTLTHGLQGLTLASDEVKPTLDDDQTNALTKAFKENDGFTYTIDCGESLPDPVGDCSCACGLSVRWKCCPTHRRSAPFIGPNSSSAHEQL